MFRYARGKPVGMPVVPGAPRVPGMPEGKPEGVPVVPGAPRVPGDPCFPEFLH